MEFLSNKPIYIQLKDYYANLIKSGVLKKGDEMPSVRDLALEYRINPNTVQRSFAILVEEGYLTSIPKKGYFVAEVNVDKSVIIESAINDLLLKGIEEKEIIDYIKGRKNKW